MLGKNIFKQSQKGYNETGNESANITRSWE